MKIGDEVYVHGYVDEIRYDDTKRVSTIIIRNDGGYFGTVPSEIDRKTEPQFDKDINVRSKTEQNMAEDIVESFGFKAESYRQAKAKTEPQRDCETCKHYNPHHEAIACERCLDGKYSRYEPEVDCSWK